jgi:hypothetical protein
VTLAARLGVFRRASLLGLVLAALLTQAARLLFDSLRSNSVFTSSSDRLFALAVAMVALGLVLAAVLVWARVAVGRDLLAWGTSHLPHAPSEAVPSRYAVRDAPRLLAFTLLAVLDIGVLLLVQSQLRQPALVAGSELAPRALVDGAFVGVVALLALALLAKAYSTLRPLTLYASWTTLDRLVPTAGFLPARAAPAAIEPKPRTALPEPERVEAPEPKPESQREPFEAAATQVRPDLRDATAPSNPVRRLDEQVTQPAPVRPAPISERETVVAPAKPEAEPADE